MGDKIKIGVSACLLGHKVRFDGGHKHDRFITDTLGQYVEFCAVCPEVEVGFPVPRESLRLVGDPKNPRLKTTKTNVDHTDRMLNWARTRIKELENENLCGFIFKSKSPSSGMERVKVYSENGMPEKIGVGIFARAFMDHFPLIPVEEEGRLHDPKLRENFIESIFALKNWRKTIEKNRSIGNLVDFHTRQKLLLLSHSPIHYRSMGKLVADGKKYSVDELFFRYETHLLEALKLKTTLKKNINVLQHILGYFKKQLSADEKQEALEIIGQYRIGNVPLIVPITLLNHFVRKYQEPYLMKQTYLNPHPVDLKLRNHV
ncbi:MAG: DUF523 and DUF1722 domain-containing protein [Desulfobacterales bacterium]|nr:DUF523 and DUF1722 domain-containing protein [Desulfobacterales bacterium]